MNQTFYINKQHRSNTNFLKKLCLFLLICLIIFVITGCGKNSESKNTDPALFRVALCPGKMVKPSGVPAPFILASISNASAGSLVGWVESPDGTIVGRLNYLSVNGIYETMINCSTPGIYKLKYTVNNETFTIEKQISWGAASPADFQSTPSVSYDSVAKGYRATDANLNTGIADYCLRLYSGRVNSILDENISLYAESEVSNHGNYLFTTTIMNYGTMSAMVVANSKNGNDIISTTRFIVSLD